MRQSQRDGVRDISETHVNHHGRKGVKERNRVEEGERRTEDRREVGRRGVQSGKAFDKEGDS